MKKMMIGMLACGMVFTEYSLHAMDGYTTTINSVWMMISRYVAHCKLLHAVQQQDGVSVQELCMVPDIDINTTDWRKGRTPLLWAVHTGHEGIVEMLLNTPEVSLERADYHGYTPLIEAVRRHRIAIAQRLLDAGAEVNRADKAGCTPLMHAVIHRYGEDMVQLLIARHDIDINKKDHAGFTPFLYLMQRHGRQRCIEFLMNLDALDLHAVNRAGENALMLVSQQHPGAWVGGREDLITLLLRTGVRDINHQDTRGLTALMYQAFWGFDRSVEQLLAHPALNIHLRNNNGLTALMIAQQQLAHDRSYWQGRRASHERIIQLLTSYDEEEIMVKPAV